MRDPHAILLRPLLTEKSVGLARRSKYCFHVGLAATKVEIGRAVEKAFPGTKVARVNTLHLKGKTRRISGYRRRGGRSEGVTSNWKKAIVTLKEGKIPFFEGL
jgi:large subunit ribosomal protein L23